MKRPISHFLVPVFCVLMLPFCIPGSALGVEKTHGHAAGKFQLEIGNNDAGWIHSTEGGAASSEVVQEKLGPVPAKSSIAQPPQIQTPAPRQTPQLARPACPNPPCGLGQQQEALQDKKDSLSETSEEKSLQIQMYQDRHTKSTTTISNTLKKNSDTQSAIISNQK